MKNMYAGTYIDLWSVLFKSVFSFSHHELYSSYLQTLPFIILYLICSNIEIKILILYNIYDHVIPFAQIVHLCPEMHAIEKMANLAKKIARVTSVMRLRPSLCQRSLTPGPKSQGDNTVGRLI